MTAMTARRASPRRPRRTAQRGAVAIMVGVALTVLVGAVGLSIDAGRLYVTKSELQSAVDACALAAARELVCTGTTNTSCLDNARAAGQTVAARHKANLQASTVSATVTFASTLSGTYASNAPAAARHVRCTAQVSGIVPWLMGVLGAGSSTVAASAVATTTPAQDFCLSAPLALCSKGSGSNFGYTLNEWITAASNKNDGDLSGSVRWARLSTQSVSDQLEGSTPVCGIAKDSTVTLLNNGTQNGSKSAYNTRFGLYQGSGTAATSPPDRTGYAYPTPALAVGADVYGDYMSRRASFTPFTPGDYKGNAPGKGNANGSYFGTPLATNDLYQQYGADRRLIAVATVAKNDCDQSSNTVSAKLTGVACLLMLNPMGNGAKSDLYFQYLGNASSGTTPCGSTGTPGGSTSSGPRVPVLAQ